MIQTGKKPKSWFRIHLVVLLALMLAGCEQTNYRVLGNYDDEYGECITASFHSRQYGRGVQLADTYQGLIENSYLVLRDDAQIWFSPEPGGNYEVDPARLDPSRSRG